MPIGRADPLPRNVPLITPVLPPAPGGTATYAMVLGRSLVELGIADRAIRGAAFLPPARLSLRPTSSGSGYATLS
jgi:hypothetical protein